MMRSKIWITGYFLIIAGLLGIVVGRVVRVDPFFHYHKPLTEKYYYSLDNQRNVNDGIVKHFDYDALIAGTSMVENFRTTEMDSVFGVHSVKVPFAGGSYKEINDNLAAALAYNPNLRIIVRGLDMAYFFDHKDRMREDLGVYPTYLYDNNIFNDVKYVLNRDIIFKRVYSMIKAGEAEDFVPGMIDFDQYSYWMDAYTFGANAVLEDEITFEEPGTPVHMTDGEREVIRDNIEQNVIALAEKYPDVTFYCFFTPYSAAWWESRVADGTIYKQIEAEECMIEQILECPNIKLYSFNNRTDITTDLNNYKDLIHYGAWVNSLILKWMHSGQYLLTRENYSDYLAEELSFYTSYDYSALQTQADYENNYFAAALLNQELSGAGPLEILPGRLGECELMGAEVVRNPFDDTLEIECRGSLQRPEGSEISVGDYLAGTGYAGMKITIDEMGPYRYLVFYGRKNMDHGQPGVYVYNESNGVEAAFEMEYYEIDNGEHQYVIDISDVAGRAVVIFNGGYTDDSGSEESSYTFRNITLY